MAKSSYNTTYSTIGKYTYFIWANDNSQNSNISSNYTFIIKDGIKPEIKDIVDFPDPQQMGGWVNISCRVTDNVEVGDVRINVSYPDGLKINVTMDDTGNKYYYNETYHIPGIYTYFIWANDSSGNNNKSSSHEFVVENTSHILHLLKGWNLITLPFENNYNVSSLYNAIEECSIILSWNASIQDFELYVPGSPYDFEIEDGYGYFIGMNNNSIFSLNGFPITNVSINLSIGWNCLGWFKENETNASSLYNAIDNCTIVLKWNASLQNFELYVPGAPDFLIKRGEGFMVAVTQQSIWYGG